MRTSRALPRLLPSLALCGPLTAGCAQPSKGVGEFDETEGAAATDGASTTSDDPDLETTTDASPTTATSDATATTEATTDDATTEATTTEATTDDETTGPTPLEIDLDAFESQLADGCVAANSGVDVDQLIADGIVFGGDGSPITCSVEDALGHGALPAGIDVAADCVATGVVAPSLPLGAYAWIVTLTQEGSGSTVHLPYCAPQTAPHPDAYDIAVTHEGGDVTFTPDYTDLFGDDPPREVIVQVARPCEFMSCFFAYYASLSAVGLTGVSAAPVSSLEGGGFEHGVDVSVDELPDEFLDRFHVIQTRWDYCLSGSDSAPQVAQDEHFALCGREALAQEHGDDSNLEYDLIVRPL